MMAAGSLVSTKVEVDGDGGGIGIEVERMDRREVRDQQLLIVFVH